MPNKSCFVVCGCFILACTLTLAAQNPIVVYPSPAQFGIVDLNSTSYPVTFFVSNITSGTINVTGMTISGTNSGDFAFYGSNCVGYILGNQSCQMAMTFTPLGMGSRSASLMIAVSGVPNPISVSLLGTGGNPLPTLTSISPPTGYEGSASIPITLTGTGFLPSSVVYSNNAPIATTYVSSTQLTAQIPASALANVTADYIYVSNPGPGGGSSTSIAFQVVSLDPSINSLAPDSLIAGAPASTLVVNGNNFMSNSTVLWNGTALPTTFVSSQQLQAQLSLTNLAKATIAQVSVSNPYPGGLSNSTPFNVTYTAVVRILNLPANDLVWDPFAQRIYASMPSSYGLNGNTIAVINPVSGSVTAYHYAGSEPNQLALSSTANYLYVGLNGNGSVERFLLPGFTPDININLGTNGGSGINMAGNLAVFPSDPHSSAVVLMNGCCYPGPVEFFTDTTKLANTVSNTQILEIQFANSTTLYGYDNGIISSISVGSTGGTLAKQWNGYVSGVDMQYAGGLIYTSGGQAFNPTTAELVGTFDLQGSCCSPDRLLPDPAINRAFDIGVTPFFNSFGVTSYNLSKFTAIAVTNLEQLGNGYGTSPANAILWGSNGLAFLSQTGCCGNATSQVVIVQSSTMFLTAPTNNLVPTLTALSPSSATHGGGNFKLYITGSNFYPGTQVTWNGTHLSVSYLSPTKLIAYVPRKDIASPGTAMVAVINPSKLLAATLSSVASFTIK